MATPLAGPKGGYLSGSAAAIRRDQLGFYESCARHYGRRDAARALSRPADLPPGRDRGAGRGPEPRKPSWSSPPSRRASGSTSSRASPSSPRPTSRCGRRRASACAWHGG